MEFKKLKLYMPVVRIPVDKQDPDDYYNDTINGVDPFCDIDAVIEEEREKAEDEGRQMLADEVIEEFKKGGRNAK